MAYHPPNDISQDIPLEQPPFSNNSTGKDHWLNSAILRQQAGHNNSNIFLNLQTNNNNNLDSSSSQHHLHNNNNNNQWLSRPILHRNVSNVTGGDSNDFNDHSRNLAAGQV